MPPPVLSRPLLPAQHDGEYCEPPRPLAPGTRLHREKIGRYCAGDYLLNCEAALGLSSASSSSSGADANATSNTSAGEPSLSSSSSSSAAATAANFSTLLDAVDLEPVGGVRASGGYLSVENVRFGAGQSFLSAVCVCRNVHGWIHLPPVLFLYQCGQRARTSMVAKLWTAVHGYEQSEEKPVSWHFDRRTKCHRLLASDASFHCRRQQAAQPPSSPVAPATNIAHTKVLRHVALTLFRM